MTQSDIYLKSVLEKYEPANILIYQIYTIPNLLGKLQNWAGTCYLQVLSSGSRAKGTAISIASDVDYMVSLSNGCNGTLKEIYQSLYNTLNSHYPGKVRKQNVSVRIKIDDLDIDVTPARKLSGNTNSHTLYVSKLDTWKQTNVQQHINDISKSGRLNEIKLLKIWRELFNLEFPSIYLEYLLITNILYNKNKGDDYLADNFFHVLKQLALDTNNPLYSRIVDPANSGNILSDLLTGTEKQRIIAQAKRSVIQSDWKQIVW
jgi:hypothetical protein